jgi:hypothetical protein
MVQYQHFAEKRDFFAVDAMLIYFPSNDLHVYKIVATPLQNVHFFTLL